MADFGVTQERLEKIAQCFDTTVEKVENLYVTYCKIANGMKQQYLAHIMRTMEDYLRKIPGNEMFQIICSPVATSAKSLGIAEAHYYKNRYFAIFYHPETEEKQLRMMLAHELGHLFLLEIYNTHHGSQHDEKMLIEPMSTILGVFTILDKNDFYHNKIAPFKHGSVDEVLNDFSLLFNRDAGKLNLSS